MLPCTKLAIVATMLLCVATAFASPVVNNVDVGGRPSGNVDGRRAYTQQIISRTQPTGASGYMQCVATPAATHAIFQTSPAPLTCARWARYYPGYVNSTFQSKYFTERVAPGAAIGGALLAALRRRGAGQAGRSPAHPPPRCQADPRGRPPALPLSSMPVLPTLTRRP